MSRSTLRARPRRPTEGGRFGSRGRFGRETLHLGRDIRRRPGACKGGTGCLARPQERLVAADSDPVAVPAVREVVEHGVVLNAAIVPEGDGVGLPLEAALELRRLDVAIEHLEQGVALVSLELRNAQGEAAIDVEALSAGYRWVRTIGCSALGNLMSPRSVAFTR